MRIGAHNISIPVFTNYRLANAALYDSMRKISSGERIERPGDAPAEMGISESFRFQLRNSLESQRTIDNARNMMLTSDAWMQEVQNMLGRMGELAAGASDSSKNDADRAALNEEYTQLKAEIGRVARDAKYNKVQVMGRDQVLSYDRDKETFVFSQLDGSEAYALPTKILSGLSATNNLGFLFGSGNDYVLSHDGASIFYVDSNDDLVKYNIEGGTIARDSAVSGSIGLEVDEQGRLWYAESTAPGVYSLKQQDTLNWTQDTDILAGTEIVDMASTEFKVYDDRVYYLNTSGEIVSRSIINPAEIQVELSNTSFTLSTAAGRFAISEDGLFVADVPASGTVRVINTETQEYAVFMVDPNASISDIHFSVDTQELFFLESGSGEIRSIAVDADDTPEFGEIITVREPSGASGFDGLSLDGGSHRARFKVHNGPDAGQTSVFLGADVRLNTLGLTRTDITTIDKAQEALRAVDKAVDRMSVQRALVGAQYSRLTHSYNSLADYVSNVEQADSRLRDTDIASESALLAAAQVRYQATTSLMVRANQIPQAILRLFDAR